MLSVLTEWVKINTQKAALEEEIKTTEYLFLKSQMSPHFLFNTLNNIYGLSITNHEKTPEAIAQLKGLMSYIEVYESGQKITLEEEYTHLTNYIALNELRYAVKVNWLIKVSNSSLLIEPMLLLPIIENAFKHGDTSEHGVINIYFSEKNNKLNFECSNGIINTKKDKTSGIGIQNIQRRLSLLYPNTSSITLDKSVELFDIKISIKL